MTGAEDVVLRFVPAQELPHPVFLADGSERLSPSGQHLVRVALVTDVPNEPVARGIEDVVQRDGELDRAQPRGEMAARA